MYGSMKNFFFTICTLLIGLQNCHLYYHLKNITKKVLICDYGIYFRSWLQTDVVEQNKIENKYVLTNSGCIYTADLDDAVNGTGGQLLNC